MKPTSYLVSDLHLSPGASALGDVFRRFLAGPARAASAVYILGDLFEYWIGDDAGLAAYPAEVAALAELTRSGVPVYFQHGNRDFLVGDGFSRATGVRLLPDPHRLELAGTPTLLSHGDQYCTADVGYQRWRRFSRNPLAQAVYRRLPRSTRERIAGGVRAQSDSQKQYKPGDIMDVTDAAVRNAFEQSGADRLIHGHTHRPAEHRYEIAGRACERIVLADWRPDRCEALRVDGTGCERIALS